MRVACLFFNEKTDVSKIAEYLLRYSPQICLREGHGIFIEIGKCERLFSESGFILRANALLRRLDVKANIGVADSISRSLVAAIYGTLDFSLLPLEALYDFTDPFNTDTAAREQISLMLDAMKKLAIRNLFELSNIPNHELPSRFGKAALLCKLRLTNELLVPWREWHPDEIIFESKDLTDVDHTGGLEPLLFEIKALLDKLFSRLWSRGLKCASLSLVVNTEKISTQIESKRVFNFDFISPQSTTKGALGIIKVRLEKDFQKNPLRAVVEAIELEVTGHVPGFLSQRNIFHNREDINESLGALINQLSESHGRENIFYAKPVEDRLPEKSWVKTIIETDLDFNLQGLMPERPMYLLVPTKIEVTNGKIFLNRKSFRIRSWANYAEMISSHWLEEKIDRTYYQVEIHDGPTLWIFQDPGKNYFLHGYYG